MQQAKANIQILDKFGLVGIIKEIRMNAKEDEKVIVEEMADRLLAYSGYLQNKSKSLYY